MKVGWRKTDLGWDRPHSAIPSLFVDRQLGRRVILPGNTAAYEFDYQGTNWEIADSVVLNRGRHLITAGGGMLLRRPESVVSWGRDGVYQFRTIDRFAQDMPYQFRVTVDRETATNTCSESTCRFEQSPYDRKQSNNQFFAFVQENLKLKPGLNLSVGLRYESFGTLTNTGYQDGYLRVGPGESPIERIEQADYVYDQSRHLAPYRPDRNNWAGRLGLTYDLFGRGTTVFRSAYGIFYDRLFDNLTLRSQLNNQVLLEFKATPPSHYSDSGGIQQVLTGLAGTSVIDLATTSPKPLWIDEGLRTPYVQSWLAAIQHRFSESLSLEISHMGAAARKLIATDQVNRRQSTTSAYQATLTLIFPRTYHTVPTSDRQTTRRWAP